MDARLTAYLAALPKPAGQDSAPDADVAPPGVAFWKQLRDAGLIWHFGALTASHLVATGLLLASWGFIGYGALSGRLDRGWLLAWALCLATALPLQLAGRSLQGSLSVGFGGLLKQRLLAGALGIDPDLMRRKGAGELLGEVLESETIEELGTNGGFEMVFATLELLLVPLVLARGAAAVPEIVLLVAWCLLCLILFATNLRLRSAWTGLRLSVTHRTVENMTSHRTRLVQQVPSEWHRFEDRDLQKYDELSELLDRSTAWIQAMLAPGYVIASLATLAPSLIAAGTTVAQRAITLGAVLFAGAALERLTFGASRATAAWMGWRTVKPVFETAAQPVTEGVAADLPSTAKNVLHVQDVEFTHQGRTNPVLKGCSLTFARGDFLLLEGDSGSGKSTFAALLAGWRKPSSGVILAGALDRGTLGDSAWKRRVASVPQYHENHILSAPLSFNLLMGRSYPNSPQDLEEARSLCAELGLSALLERMPAGLGQMVGETGWQLSHGERSRVFLARALLQRAEVVVLDETLAALDPENVQQCLECVMRRSGTLLVVAHP